jgi:hypothetical protein
MRSPLYFHAEIASTFVSCSAASGAPRVSRSRIATKPSALAATATSMTANAEISGPARVVHANR